MLCLPALMIISSNKTLSGKVSTMSIEFLGKIMMCKQVRDFMKFGIQTIYRNLTVE